MREMGGMHQEANAQHEIYMYRPEGRGNSRDMQT